MRIRSSMLWLAIAAALAVRPASAFQEPKAKLEAAEPAEPKSAETSKDKDLDADEPKKGAEKPKGKAKPEVATFGAGCFWSTEAVFERLPGVLSVESGFSGGQVPNPSYELVCTGNTGHAEAVNVTFDPDVTDYGTLLRAFWSSHDPTTPNRQGDDFGTQYRSAIFYHSEAQKKEALRVYRELVAKRTFRSPIVTELLSFNRFYPAEPYHQDYFRHNRGSEYSLAYIIPKLRKLHLLDVRPRSAAQAKRPLDRDRTIEGDSAEDPGGEPEKRPAEKSSSRVNPPARGR